MSKLVTRHHDKEVEGALCTIVQHVMAAWQAEHQG
jgi:hypothetical protein